MDLGGMWMSGRLQPDHSTIGKFIQLPRLLADAGYHALELLSDCVARDIDVLIPAGIANSDQPWQKRQRKGKLPKSAFHYDSDRGRPAPFVGRREGGP
jgi:hypothetical protein